MLAQSFKTAEELNITEKQRDALMKTLVLLETGKLVHATLDAEVRLHRSEKFTGHFNMNVWNEKNSCGTVCCIGGTAELIGNVNFDFGRGNDPLHNLFYPPSYYEFNEITPLQAATALRSYLTTGSVNWKDVIGDQE